MTRVRWVKMGKQWKTICHVPDTMDADLPKGALVSKSSVLSTGIPPWHHGIVELQGSIPRRSPSKTGALGMGEMARIHQSPVLCL